MIGTVIKELRKERRWTQLYLAKQLSVTVVTCSKIENEIELPNLSLLNRLVDLFDIGYSELINGSSAQEKHEIATLLQRLDLREREYPYCEHKSLIYMKS